jgi:hypothetical protein
MMCALSLTVVATAALFVGRDGPLLATPGARAAAGAVLVALTALGFAAGTGRGPAEALAVALVLGVSVLCWTAAGRDWTIRGTVAWSMTIDVALAYLAYVGIWILTADLAWYQRALTSGLWLVEAFVFVLAIGHVWELVDVLARRRWHRRVVTSLPAAGTHRPFVSLHVPTHNEPPDLVIATLESLMSLEYDDYEVLLLDNNTSDPSLWQPVEEFCSGHDRIRFFHLVDWPGYKSGALNHGLEQADPRTELVGIIDADYQVEPEFLVRCAPLFSEADLGFLQTPQDYREWELDGYFRRLYHSYKYFFDVSQVSRNERDAPIFGGTMGLIRRDALTAVGGWDEWCITEDAELSLRLLKAGWRGTHIDEPFGRGIMPLTFEALKRQRFRWCFGGIQILRLHWRALLPGRRTEDNQMSLAQRWAYLVGGLQWYGDLAALVFTAFLVMGAVDSGLGGGLLLRRLTPTLLVCVVALVLLGIIRSVALARRLGEATWREALGSFGIWLALGWSVAQGSARGLFARQGAFLRTPKVRGELSWRDAIRGNRVETFLAAVCLVAAAVALAPGGPGALAVACLLLIQGAGYAAAPLNSLAAIRSDLPSDLRRRRRDQLRSWVGVGQPVRRGGMVTGLTALALLALVVFAAPLGGPVLDQLPGDLQLPGRGDAHVEEQGRRTPSTTPGGSPSLGDATLASSLPSGTPSRTPSQTPSQGPGSTATTAPGSAPTGPPTVTPSAQPTTSPTRTAGTTPTKPQQASTGSHPTGAPTGTGSPTQRP